MTRSEISKLAESDGFRPFLIITSGGARYSIDHPDYIDIPPIPDPEADEGTFPFCHGLQPRICPQVYRA